MPYNNQVNKQTPMKFVGLAFGVVVLAFVGILFEAWLLGLILSWFGVSLTFWQNFAIIFLANAIFKTNVSSK